MNIREIAVKATTMSELMEGREKIDTKDIINDYPKGVHICAAEPVAMTDGSEFWVFLFEEEPTKFAFAGYVLNKIFNKILEYCEGDVTSMNSELAKQNLGVRLYEGKTKDKKQPITMVDVI